MQKLKKWATDKRLFSGVMVLLLIISVFIPLVAGVALIYFMVFMLALDKVGDEARVKRLVDAEYRKLDVITHDVKELREEQKRMEFEVDMKDYALYTPKFQFVTALGYKDALRTVREEQKEGIDSKSMVEFSDTWTVNGSLEAGQVMTENNIKRLFRSFNNECDIMISRVTYKNIDIIEERMKKTFEDLNVSVESQLIEMKPEYLDLKIKELRLAHEYALKKREETEDLRRSHWQEREDKRVSAQIADERVRLAAAIEDNKDHIERFKAAIPDLPKEKIVEAERLLEELRDDTTKKEAEMDRLVYTMKKPTAGYVYVVSNVGAFGPGVVKIGVTRRLDPMEGIALLSTNVLPFTYDVHALVYSPDAYQLRDELHEHFKQGRVNKVDDGTDFFRVSLIALEKKLNAYEDLTVDFKSEVVSEDFQKTLAIERGNVKTTE